MAQHWVGTSGWSYATWRGLFYPRGLKQGAWLEHYAQHLGSVELNASFYRLPSESMLDGWRERTPPGFRFAVKAWRAITHYHRLRDCAALLARFYARVDRLGDKCGPVLFQLPPRFPPEPAALDAVLALLPAGGRATVECRDPRWHNESVYAVLRRHNAAFCPFELGAQRGPRVVTADFVYVRLHGRKPGYRGRYSDAALADWAGWLGENLTAGRDAYVYFDNTDEADHAVRNAMTLNALLQAQHGTKRS